MARLGQRELARAEAWQRGLEDELERERADALGRTGRRLDDALVAYHDALAASAGDLAAEDADPLIDAIATHAYSLIIQRESAGLVVDNLAHVRAAYDVPDAAMRRLGVVRHRPRHVDPSCARPPEREADG